MEKRKNIVYGLALMVLVVIGLWLASDSLSNNRTATEYGGSATTEETIVTKKLYDQIAAGMSYEEIAALIGHPGEEQLSTEAGGVTTKTFVWYNQPPASFITVTFQNGKYLGKSQVNLH